MITRQYSYSYRLCDYIDKSSLDFIHTVYRGDFSNNLIDGKGIMRYSNGDVYEGQWENGLVCAAWAVHCHTVWSVFCYGQILL